MGSQVCVVVVVVTIILTVLSNRVVRAIVRHLLPKGNVMVWRAASKPGDTMSRLNGVNTMPSVVVPGIGTISRPHNNVAMRVVVVKPTVFKANEMHECER